MRRLSKTITLVGTTALTCAVALTAHAQDGVAAPSAATSFGAALFERRVPLNGDVYHATLDAKLARLAALAETMRAKVGAIPIDEVLTGTERRAARLRLARVAKVNAVLDAIPRSGMYAPTEMQRRTIARIVADLDAIVARLKILLANEPAPVAAAPVNTGKTDVSDTTEWWRHECRGWDGRDAWNWRDGDRDGDRDGWRDSAWRG